MRRAFWIDYLNNARPLSYTLLSAFFQIPPGFICSVASDIIYLPWIEGKFFEVAFLVSINSIIIMVADSAVNVVAAWVVARFPTRLG